jgi:hypothetical protein
MHFSLPRKAKAGAIENLENNILQSLHSCNLVVLVQDSQLSNRFNSSQKLPRIHNRMVFHSAKEFLGVNNHATRPNHQPITV